MNTLLYKVMIDKIIEQYEEESFLKADGFKTPIWCSDNFD
jgi:hypothetical protein